MLARELPLTVRRDPFRRESELPLLRLTRLPATLRTLAPDTFTSEPIDTSILLALRATSAAALLVRRLWSPRAIASPALVSWLPFLRWSKGAEASRRAWSRRTT